MAYFTQSQELCPGYMLRAFAPQLSQDGFNVMRECLKAGVPQRSGLFLWGHDMSEKAATNLNRRESWAGVPVRPKIGEWYGVMISAGSDDGESAKVINTGIMNAGNHSLFMVNGDGYLEVAPGETIDLARDLVGACHEDNRTDEPLTPYADLDAEGRAEYDEKAMKRLSVKQDEKDRKTREALQSGGGSVLLDREEYWRMARESGPETEKAFTIRAQELASEAWVPCGRLIPAEILRDVAREFGFADRDAGFPPMPAAALKDTDRGI